MASGTQPPEVDRLIGDGFERYRRGDIDGALVAWEEALAVRPDPRVAGYVEYVRAHYDHLTGHAPAPLAELLVPFPLDGNDSADYEVSITHEPMGERLAEPAIDDGWWLSSEEALLLATPGSSPAIELFADEPPVGGAPFEVSYGEDDATTDYASLAVGGRAPLAVTARPPTFDPAEDSGEATFGGFGRGAPGPLDLELDLPPPLVPVAPRGLAGADYNELEVSSELTIERSVVRGRATAEPAAEFAPRVGPRAASSEATVDLGGRGATDPVAMSRQKTAQLGPSPLPSISDLTLDLDPVGAASELGIESSVPPVDATPSTSRTRSDDVSVPVEHLRLPPPAGRSRPIDDVDHAPLPPPPPRPGAGGAAAALLAAADAERRPGESSDDVARRRIGYLIERARQAALSGDHDVVAVAIDLALAESPDSAVAQKLVHKHRDTLLDCYYRSFGSLERRPIVVGDMKALGPVGIDPRAAFLLSRIDGMMTFDELLDVSGMGRLEACRHLALLIRRQLVRSEP